MADDKQKTADKEAKAKARREAKVTIRKFMASDNIKQFSGLREALATVIGSGTRRGGPRGVSPNTAILKRIQESGKKGVTEMELFKQFRVGRPDMVTKTRQFIAQPENAEDRVWVSFEPADGLDGGTYRVAGTGANPPDGWDGYIPKAEQL